MEDDTEDREYVGSLTDTGSQRPAGPRVVGVGQPVLVVVHHPADFHRLRMTLEVQLGDRRIVHATTAARAVRRLRAAAFATVLLDLDLPDSSGAEALEAVVEAARETPVVALSRGVSGDEALRLMQMGAEDVLPIEHAEGATLVRVIQYAIERRRTQAQLERLSLFDASTGLVNRGYFQLRLLELMRRAADSRKRVCVLFFDVDDFQLVNDSLGPDAGDRALRAVAERFRQALGTSEDSVAARWGGDEFVGAVCGVPTFEAALEIGRRVLEHIAEPMLLGSDEVYLTASVGVTLAAEGELDAARPIREADLAMHDAKRDGHRTIRTWSHALDESARRRLDLGRALRRAVEQGEFALHYQPQVDATSNELSGVEALLRWPEGDPELRSPAQFVPVLEATGLIQEVGLWVLKQALEDMRMWEAARLRVPRVSINVSGIQLRDRRLALIIADHVARGVRRGSLEIEVTESVLLEERFPSGEILREIAESGVDIALDDFGTGYSSLSQLVRFPINTLKIDRAFIRDVRRSARHEALLSSILAMGDRLGLRTVVEGVETEGELAEVVRLGARDVQGYVYARPMDREQLVAWVRNREVRSAPQTPSAPRAATRTRDTDPGSKAP